MDCLRRELSFDVKPHAEVASVFPGSIFCADTYAHDIQLWSGSSRECFKFWRTRYRKIPSPRRFLCCASFNFGCHLILPFKACRLRRKRCNAFETIANWILKQKPGNSFYPGNCSSVSTGALCYTSCDCSRAAAFLGHDTRDKALGTARQRPKTLDENWRNCQAGAFQKTKDVGPQLGLGKCRGVCRKRYRLCADYLTLRVLCHASQLKDPVKGAQMNRLHNFKAHRDRLRLIVQFHRQMQFHGKRPKGSAQRDVSLQRSNRPGTDENTSF